MGAMAPTATGIATPAGLLVRIRATGAIDVEPNPTVLAGWGANAIGAGDLTMARPTGPAGNQYGFLKLKVSLQAGSLAGIDLAPVGGDSMQVERVVLAPNAGTLIAERTYIGGEISCYSPGRLECPPLLHNAESALEPFWKLQGQHVVEAELLAAELTLQADQRTVTPHRVVTFTAGSDPASVPAVQWIQYGIIATAAVPLQVTQWRWVPDSGAGQTVACTHTQKVCSVSVEESGTMYVDALVNGEEKTKSSHIDVYAGSVDITLTASPAFTMTPGEATTVTAEPVPLELNGQAVQVTNYRWKANGATPGNCPDGASANPCVVVINSLTTVTVTATVNGTEKTAELQVAPCPTSDTLLDKPVVRSGLERALRHFQATGVEGAIVIVQDSFMSAPIVQWIDDPLASACAAHPVNIQALQDNGWNVIATAHPHLHTVNTWYYCPLLGHSTPTPPGAGDEDWSTYRMMLKKAPGLPHYIITPDFIFPMYPDKKSGSEKQLKIEKKPGCGWTPESDGGANE